MLQETIDPVWAAAISQIINFRQGVNDSSFAKLWSNLFFIIQTYNFFTCFFWIGIEGRPTGLWYAIEILTEILMIFDFVVRWLIRVYFEPSWLHMYLLHDRGGVTNFNFFIRLLASFPFTMVTTLTIGQMKIEIIDHIGFSFLRLFKLLKFGQVVEFFNALEFKKRQQSNYSLNQTLFMLYYFACFGHVMACMWCLTARIDVESIPGNAKGWFNLGLIYQYNHTVYDIYRDSFFFTQSTMNGAGPGNIYGSTNLEFFTDSLINVLGASIFIGFFAEIVTEWTLRNIQTYDNTFKYELAKQFCDMRNLPMGIRLKIRYFYQNIRIDYNEYYEKSDVLQQLPESLQGKIALMFNKEVLSNVKFFQMSRPDFITEVARKLTPEVCLTGDFVVKVHEIADKMYFIQQGSMEVLATDNNTVIAFIGKGAYFGEIGVLITGKRSVSIRALSNCMTYIVKSNDFLNILDRFPEQTKFLRAVGYQRLQTSNSSDLLSSRSPQNQENITESPGEITLSQRSSQDPKSKYDSDISFLRQNTMPDSKKLQNDKVATKFWLTKQYSSLDYFIIMPFSGLFYLWNTVILIAFTYIFILVPYGIAYNKDYSEDPGLVICQIIYIVDMPMRMRTGITQPKRITSDLQQVFDYYINSWLFYDMLATIPVEYILHVYYPELARWIMLLKLLKIVRLQETLEIYLKNTNNGQYASMFAVYFYLFCLLSYFSGCGYVFIALNQADSPSTRFDGQTLGTNFKSKSYTNGDPSKFAEFDCWAFYYYLSSSVLAGQLYGDVTPLTEAEQWWTLITEWVGRLLLVFAFSETSQYLGEIYKAQSRQLMSTQYLDKWMKMIKLPPQLIERIKEFNAIQSRYQHKIDENEVLKELPPTLKNDIKSNLFAPLIRNWEAISKENIGEVMSILNELDLITFPENEYIVKTGEVAEEMYFIVDGLCQVVSSDGQEIDILKQGQNFGEMALLDPELPLRMASVKSLTNVNLAVLTKEKFEILGIMYPQFQENIQKIVKRRLKLSLTKQNQDADLRLAMLNKLQKSNSISITSSLSEVSEESVDLDQNIEIKDQSSQGHHRKQSSQNKLNQAFKISNVNSQNQMRVPSSKFQSQNQIIQMQQKKNMFKNPKRVSSKRLQVYTNDSDDFGRQASSNSLRSKFSHGTQGGGLKRQSTMQFTDNLAKHFKELGVSGQKTQSGKYLKKITLKQFFKYMILALVNWNVWFVPIQTAFKFPINGIFLIFEALTIVLYAIEGFYRIFKLRHLQKINQISERKLSIKDRKLKQDYEKLLEKIWIQKLELICTCVAILPINLILDRTNKWPADYNLQILVMSLRLVKYRPIPRFFDKISKINLPVVRVIQVLYYNYIISNWYSSIMLLLVIQQKDATENWLRRLPVPINGGRGVRTDPNIWQDHNSIQLYIYAQYYVQSTLSHVAIGDVTATNSSEFWYNSIFMITSTFIYCYLFSNIASIVSNLSSEVHLSFMKKRNIILDKLKNDQIPSQVIEKVNLFYDYQFNKFNGLTEKEITVTLPERIKLDIMLTQYKQVIDQCILFRMEDGECDITLANTVLRTIKTQIFLSEQYLVRIGERVMDTFIILEGLVHVCSYKDNENLGLMSPGDFFGTDLYHTTDDTANKQYFQYSQGEGYPIVKLEALDNYDNRSQVNLISKSFLIIGSLESQQLEILYNAFPVFEKNLKQTNRFLFDVGRKQVEKYIIENKRKLPTRELCLKTIKNHFSYSTNEIYVRTMQQQRAAAFVEIKNLTICTKNYFIKLQNQSIRKKLKRELIGKNRPEFIAPIVSEFSCCCEDYTIEEHSTQKNIIRYVNFLNLVYTAFALPFVAAFDLRLRGWKLAVEIFSTMICVLVFVLNFRTPYIENGEKSLDFSKVAMQYFKHGMIADFFGMLPLNIVLDFFVSVRGDNANILISCIIGLLHCSRMLSCWEIIHIFEVFKLQFKKQKFMIQTAENLLFILVVGHWIVCFWIFTIYIIEQHEPINWWKYQNLQNDNLWAIYLHCWYAVLNITTGAGLADVFAVTDLERIFFCFMMNCGDIVFAFAFGLISQIALSSRIDDETGSFIKQIVKIERLTEKFDLGSVWKDRIEQFFTYKQKIKNSFLDLNAKDLEQSLPKSLVRIILFFQYRNLVGPMLRIYKSENLIREICYQLKSKIFMPDDVIIMKGQNAEEMYFLVEGSANLISDDGFQIISKLGPGAFFGESATVLGKLRNITVKAHSFCLLKVITRTELVEIMLGFPEIYEDFKMRCEEKYNHQARHQYLGIEQTNAQSLLANSRMHSEYNELLGQHQTQDDEKSHNTSKLDYDDDPSSVMKETRRQALRIKAQTEELNSGMALKNSLGAHDFNEQYDMLNQYMPQPAKKQSVMQIFSDIQQQLHSIFKPIQSNKVGVQTSENVSTTQNLQTKEENDDVMQEEYKVAQRDTIEIHSVRTKQSSVQQRRLSGVSLGRNLMINQENGGEIQISVNP